MFPIIVLKQEIILKFTLYKILLVKNLGQFDEKSWKMLIMWNMSCQLQQAHERTTEGSDFGIGLKKNDVISLYMVCVYNYIL